MASWLACDMTRREIPRTFKRVPEEDEPYWYAARRQYQICIYCGIGSVEGRLGNTCMECNLYYMKLLESFPL